MLMLSPPRKARRGLPLVVLVRVARGCLSPLRRPLTRRMVACRWGSTRRMVLCLLKVLSRRLVWVVLVPPSVVWVVAVLVV